MEVKYVAEFRVNDVAEQQERKPLDSNEIVDKKRKFDTKLAGKLLTTGVGAVLTSSRIYSQLQSTSNSIRGDSVAQRQLDNRMAYLNEGLTVGAAIGIAALSGGATVVAAATALAVNYGLRAFQTSQQNQVKQANWQVESIVNQQKQNRLVKDITGVRI